MLATPITLNMESEILLRFLFAFIGVSKHTIILGNGNLEELIKFNECFLDITPLKRRFLWH